MEIAVGGVAVAHELMSARFTLSAVEHRTAGSEGVVDFILPVGESIEVTFKVAELCVVVEIIDKGAAAVLGYGARSTGAVVHVDGDAAAVHKAGDSVVLGSCGR